MAALDTGELISALEAPEAYPRPPEEVEVLQTHVSVLFFAGDRVYKVKKPVRLPFVDFSELATRRWYCEEEVRLNSRLSSWMYHGVVPIVREEGGGLRVDAQGEPVEYAVEMERLPTERMLDRMLDRGAIDNRALDTLVDLLVTFHASAETGPGIDEFGTHEAVTRNARENFEQVRDFRGEGRSAAGTSTLSPRLFEFLANRSERFLEEERPLFERRIRDGRIREGHGDLHAGNICFAPQGLTVYDCIEFEPRFRCGDVAADLAFLAMDLDHRGYVGSSGYLVHRYAERAPDPDLPRLMRFYKGYRAVVRAKVASFLAVDPEVRAERRAEAAEEARSYFHLAAGYELPKTLFLMCGLPGSGKSWLARRIVRPFGSALVRSDVRRKRLAGIAPGATGSQHGLYTDAMKRDTYQSLLRSALDLLEGGRSVVVDATFSRREWRRLFLDASLRLGHPCFVVQVEATDDVTRRRLAQRASAVNEASDADVAVYERARSSFEPPDEVPVGRLLLTRSGEEPPDDAIGRLVDLMIRGGE